MEISKHSESMETQIIEVAKQMFLEYGYKNTNMCDIASNIGINRTTLHYYYNTKEKLFQAVFGTIIQTFLPKIQDILINEEPFFDKLGKVIDIYFDIFLTTPYLPKFIISEINRDVNQLLNVAYSVGFGNYIELVSKIINQEMDKGNMKRVEIHIILMSFISQLTFPFIAKNLIEEILRTDNKKLEDIIQQWKEVIMMQMKALLKVNK
ncbi:MAG: TetR/AcrR family transcriptional regulator [Bacteroidales bacterium]|jgi:AcrR family transcriptional regulator|nr:TetR/AcrR family transcriptional regulator [Bacteroidales bacterium]MDD4001230.1 TetR/AcrR family transcriptional regulator [Bacteroidales bacterium]MDD4529086.1 TetR/AcrR family transcriptional regulator [Bacteroidales bacterium]MDD4829285.1 TetR/AcrR family transcriptional regulator [Bacteroidales bacterium]